MGEDLVYVHHNLRSLSPNSEEYNEEETKMWDIGGDGFDSFQGADIVNFATISLDEPTMEAILLRMMEKEIMKKSLDYLRLHLETYDRGCNFVLNL